MRGDIAQNAFVNGTRHEELEARITAVAHVGKVLVRKQLEQHGRSPRNARFVIGAVPQSPAVPVGLPRPADVRDDLRHHQIGQVARAVAVGASFETALVLLRIEDAQRADRLVAVAHASIGVERQRKIHGNAQSARVGHPLRAAHQGIDPVGARHVVVLIVIRPLFGRVDLLVESGPLEPVTGTLAEAGITACLLEVLPIRRTQRVAYRAGDIAVSAADLHGIGREQTPRLPRGVRQRYDGLLTRIEQKFAEVDPGSAAHRLIDRKLRVAPEVMDRILRIIGMLRRRHIAHIDSILAPLGNIDPPYGAGRGLAADRTGLARRTVAEGILTRTIDLAQRGKSHTARLPSARLDISCRCIVVRKEFMRLYVALARQQHAGSGSLEHRDQIRQHIALRIEVLTGLPQLRALPLPAVRMLVEIAPVALPKGDMASGKPLFGTGGNRQRFDQRTRRTIGKRNNPAFGDLLAELLRIAVCQRNQLGNLASVGVEFDPRLAIGRRQQSPH